MTNETIINGVDVSGCRFYFGMGACGAGKNHESSCMYNKNCAFKQSARKDELIEELKEKITKILETELQELDIDWDEYEVSCRETDYSVIVTTCEEALQIINGIKNG